MPQQTLKIVPGMVIDFGAGAPQIVDHGELKPPPCIHLGEPTGETFPPPDGLGDYIESALSAVGVTKDRWSALVAKFKATPNDEGGGCGGCNWRQRLANKAGEWLGMGSGKGPELTKLAAVTELPPRPLCACGIYGRCVPEFRPDEGLRAAMEAESIGACVGCPKYKPVEISPSAVQ